MIHKTKATLAALFACVLMLTGALALADEAPLVGMPNPMVETTPEEILDLFGVEIKLPAGADEDAAYFLYNMSDYQMAEVQFTADEVPYAYRFNPAEGFEDNSGMFYGDNIPFQEVAIGDADGELYIIQEGLSGYVLWYDDSTGLMYSLSATDNAESTVLVELANEMYK